MDIRLYPHLRPGLAARPGIIGAERKAIMDRQERLRQSDLRWAKVLRERRAAEDRSDSWLQGTDAYHEEGEHDEN